MNITMSGPQKLGVGVIGAGVSVLAQSLNASTTDSVHGRVQEVFQVCHGPCLFLLSHLFSIESVCDVSLTQVNHCATKFSIPHKTKKAEETIDHPKVDVVFILTSDETHAELAIRSLEAGKYVFIEKPVSLSIPSVERIISAEKQAKDGARVFVGYMRRYAPSYLEAFKREVASMPKISYARVRDFSGPNAQFVNQSGTFQVKGTDFPVSASQERNEKLQQLFEEAFPQQEITDDKRKACRFLGGLGSHDISLMRETLGFPEKVLSFTANDPFYNAILQFRNPDGSSYSVTYESGIDEVPIFDAHLSVYGARKRVTIKVSYWIHHDRATAQPCEESIRLIVVPYIVRQPICQRSADRGRGGRARRTWGHPEKNHALVLRRCVYSRIAAAPRVCGQWRPDQNDGRGRDQGFTDIRHDVQGLARIS